MFANSGEIGVLTDWKNQCKWVEGSRCTLDVEPSDVFPVCMSLKTLFNLVRQRCEHTEPKCVGELDCLLWKSEYYERLHISIPSTFRAVIKATDSQQWSKLQCKAGMCHAHQLPEPGLDD
eukprot:1099165-Karenia_brevis.AAC.1